MTWNKEYQADRQIWGEQPSELALFTARYLKISDLSESGFSMIDLGCGYGRDAVYLRDQFNCNILGLDKASEAIKMAQANTKNQASVRFECSDFFTAAPSGSYDIVYASNMYQLLRPGERQQFRKLASELARPGGYLFLSTLSNTDPEHAGKGKPVPGEANSFIDQKYLHLCNEDELREDFSFLNIRVLSEHKYNEPRSNGQVHHHISWLLAAQAKSQS
jgi:SAM-dependent methyltransferase